MNTNHPDFVGFDKLVSCLSSLYISTYFYSAAKGASGRKKTRTLGNQVIRKGWLSVAVSLLKGSSREYWFVLTSESLTWYRDAEVKFLDNLYILNEFSLQY